MEGVGPGEHGVRSTLWRVHVSCRTLSLVLFVPHAEVLCVFASDDNNAAIKCAVPHVVLSRWRRLVCVLEYLKSRVTPFFAEDDEPRKDGVVRIPSHIARPLCFLVIYLRLLASASSMGYRAATYDIDNDDAWAGTDISRARWTYAGSVSCGVTTRPGGPSMHSRQGRYISSPYSIMGSRCSIARRRATWHLLNGRSSPRLGVFVCSRTWAGVYCLF